MKQKNIFFFTTFLLLFLDKFAFYVIFFLIIKLKKKKKSIWVSPKLLLFVHIIFSTTWNSFYIYTHIFLVYYSFYYIHYNYLLYSSLLLSTLPTTLKVFFFSFIKLNRFCIFVAFLLYIIWFLSTSFIDRLKFYVWSHILVFFFRGQ